MPLPFQASDVLGDDVGVGVVLDGNAVGAADFLAVGAALGQHAVISADLFFGVGGRDGRRRPLARLRLHETARLVVLRMRGASGAAGRGGAHAGHAATAVPRHLDVAMLRAVDARRRRLQLAVGGEGERALADLRAGRVEGGDVRRVAPRIVGGLRARAVGVEDAGTPAVAVVSHGRGGEAVALVDEVVVEVVRHVRDERTAARRGLAAAHAPDGVELRHRDGPAGVAGGDGAAGEVIGRRGGRRSNAGNVVGADGRGAADGVVGGGVVVITLVARRFGAACGDVQDVADGIELDGRRDAARVGLHDLVGVRIVGVGFDSGAVIDLRLQAAAVLLRVLLRRFLHFHRGACAVRVHAADGQQVLEQTVTAAVLRGLDVARRRQRLRLRDESSMGAGGSRLRHRREIVPVRVGGDDLYSVPVDVVDVGRGVVTALVVHLFLDDVRRATLRCGRFRFDDQSRRFRAHILVGVRHRAHAREGGSEIEPFLVIGVAPGAIDSGGGGRTGGNARRQLAEGEGARHHARLDERQQVCAVAEVILRLGGERVIAHLAERVGRADTRRAVVRHGGGFARSPLLLENVVARGAGGEVVRELHTGRAAGRDFGRFRDRCEIRTQLEDVVVAAAGRCIRVLQGGTTTGRVRDVGQLDRRQRACGGVVDVSDLAIAPVDHFFHQPGVSARRSRIRFRPVVEVRDALDGVDDLAQAAAVIVDISCLRVEELVRERQHASEVVELGHAPLLVDHLPAAGGAGELEEETLGRVVAVGGGVDLEEPLLGAVAVFDVAVREGAEPLEEGGVPSLAEHRAADGAGAVVAVEEDVHVCPPLGV